MKLRVPPWSWDPAILGLLLWKQGNQGPIHFNGWHTVQNNKYFSQQSLRGHARQMHAWKPKWHGNMLLVHTSIHLGLFQDLSGYFPQQDFYSAIYCAVFPFAFTFYNGVTFDLLEHDMRSTIKPNKVHFGAISWLFIFLHFELSLLKNCLSSRNAVRMMRGWVLYDLCAELYDLEWQFLSENYFFSNSRCILFQSSFTELNKIKQILD